MANGTSGRDIFNGFSILNDEFHGLGGDDDIFGNAGNDQLFGDAGNDLVKGGVGSDQLFGGADNDVLISGEREPIASDVPRVDSDTLDGGSGTDRLIVTFDTRFASINGGSGTDTLQMGFDNDALQDFLDLFPSALQTDPNLFTATIDLAAGTGKYRFNGTLIAVDMTIANVENIDGSAFSETLFGNAGANVINGGDGDDTLEGRGGADTLNGGAGRDRASYSSSAALVNVDLTRTTQIGGDAEGDQLISIQDLTGSSFGDVLRGSSAANDLDGGGGNDTIEGRGGGDTIDGDTGQDTASYESSTAGVNVDLNRAIQIGGHAQGDQFTSIERLIGSAFNDTLAGSSGNNILTGGTGQDTLLGREGSDTLIGGFQNDILDGGTGTDTASFETASASVQIILGEGTADGRATHSIGGEVDTLRSIERVTGSNFADAFFGNSAANTFEGEDGNDAFFSSLGNDTYVGGDGIDTVDYSVETNKIVVNFSGFAFVNRTSAAGNFLDTLIDVERIVGTNLGDEFTSSVAGSILVGRGGNDTYIVSNSDVDVLESVGGGDDRVLASVSYALQAGQEIEILGPPDNFNSTVPIDFTGNEFPNVIVGTGGNNTLDGRGGVDALVGFGGDDIYVVDDVLDIASEVFGSGFDTVFASVDYTLADDIEDLFLVDAVFSVSGTGNGAANSIFGLFNDNLLDGAGGADSLKGVGGNDTFVLRRGEANGDTIVDFAGAERTADRDLLLFVGYGRVSEGASFQELNATQYQINSSDGLVHDIITLPATSFDQSFLFVDFLQRGTSGDDTLVGDVRDDALFGLSGSDALLGRDGNDLLNGGVGDDGLSGEAGDDFYVFDGVLPGNDIFSDSSGFDTVRFDFNTIQSIFRSGDDLIADLTDGTFTVVNHFNGRTIERAHDLSTGNVVTLATGLVGGDASGIISGTNKGETLDGRGGDDFLYGNDGKDTLLGGDGNDLLDGGRGKDVLVGGNGDDTLIGGKSDDLFVFAPGSGHDIVRDFEKGDDRIDLTAFDTSFRRLDDDRDGRLEDGEGDRHITVDIRHGDTILKFAGGSITIENVKGLGEHDFLL